MVYNNSLYHHGVKGQKWGVIRTPAQLGHKTGSKKGKKKVSVNPKGLFKRKKKLSERSKNETTLPKKVSDYSDKELQQKVNRLRMEKDYYDLNNQIASYNKPKVSKGRQYAEKFFDQAVFPAITNAGRDIITKMLKDKYGVDVNSKSAKEAKAEIKKEFSDAFGSSSGKSSKNNKQQASSKNNTNNTNRETRTENPNREERKTYSGTVHGEGTSRSKYAETGRKYTYDNFVDVDYTVVSESPRYTQSKESGRNYVSGYLEDPKKRNRYR